MHYRVRQQKWESSLVSLCEQLLWAGENLHMSGPSARTGPWTSRPVVLQEVRPYNVRAEPSEALGPSRQARYRNVAPRQPPSSAASRQPPDAADSRPGSPAFPGYDSGSWS